MEATGGAAGRKRPAAIGELIRRWWSALRERGEGLPEIPRARRAREVAVRRSGLAGAWQARVAVRSGARLEDFLRFRLARYAGELSVPASELPVEIAVEGGAVEVRARRSSPPPAAYGATYGRSPDEARWLRALVELEGPVAAREIRDAQAEVEALSARAEQQQAVVDEVAHRLRDDVAAGVVPAPAAVDAAPEQLGRPPVPSPLPPALLVGFSAALLLAETWQLATPLLALSGHATTDLSGGMRRDPIGLALALVFALGAAVSIFVLAHAAVARGADLLAEEPPPVRRRWLGGASLGAGVLAAVVAAATAGITPARWPVAALLLAVPLASAVLVRAARALEARRDEAAALALAWDRERAAELAERARRAEALALAEEDLRRTLEARAAASRRVRALEARAIAADARRREEAEGEQRRLERLADALASALELDRYAFVRRAAERAHGVLSRPAPAPVRGPRLEPTPPPTLGVAG